MEFDEMKQVWDTQNNAPMYVINENALHNRILAKQRKAGHITNFSELLSIMANAGSGAVILIVLLLNSDRNSFMFLLSAWMLATAAYVVYGRIKRLRGQKFDRSIRGDLDHALSIATYQVRFSWLMRWNIIPMALIMLLGLWDGGKITIWIVAAALVFFILTYYASGWEHNIYKGRLRELQVLKNKLDHPLPEATS